MPGDPAPQPEPSTPPTRRRRGSPHALPTLARPSVLACVWTALLIYGSLLPFDLHPVAFFADAGGFFLGLLQWLTGPIAGWAQSQGGTTVLGYSFSIVDLAVNLALYIPLGVMLRIALRRRGMHIAAQIAFASLIVFALSWLLECTQAWSPARIASLGDVIANVGTGVAAVLFAPWLWGLARHLMFRCYCRLAWPIHALRVRLRFVRRSSRAMVLLVLVNAALLTVWYATQVSQTFASPSASPAPGHLAMPFEQHFAYSYHTAALLLGRSLLVYAALGCLLSLSMLRSRAKLPLLRIVLAVLLVAIGVELYRSAAATGTYRADITEPLIAIAAALLMGITTYLFAHAIRRTNRRQTQADYQGPDRRRVRFEYADRSKGTLKN